MNYIREHITTMSGYTPGEQLSKHVIKLNTNENPYPPSPTVATAIQDASNSLRLYPQPLSDDLRTTAARYYSMPPESIMAGNGSDDLLTIIFRSFLNPGDSVYTFNPTYTLYEVLAHLQNAQLQYIDFSETYSLNHIQSIQAPLVILANPNSPTGSFIRPEDIRILAKKISGMLVIDEAYADFAPSNCLNLINDLPNVMVIRTFSKSFSLAGIRLGLAFAKPEIIHHLIKVKDSYNVNRLSMAAGIAALRDYQWMENNVNKIKASRESLSARLTDMGLTVIPSHANFLFVKNFPKPALSVYEELKKHRILVRHFNKLRTADALRITIGTDEQCDTFFSTLQSILSA